MDYGTKLTFQPLKQQMVEYKEVVQRCIAKCNLQVYQLQDVVIVTRNPRNSLAKP